MSVLLSLIPVLALVAVLVPGRYPGERVLSRARGTRRPPRRAPSATARPALPPILLVRGGVLVASSLAGRAPPAAVA
jgi:hypothetical protein